MSTKIWLPIALLVVAAGGWYIYQGQATSVPTDTQQAEADMGTYAYSCENGSQFTMAPSETMSEVTLTAGSQGMFTGTVTLHKADGGNRYEDGTIAFSGAGEEVRLEVGAESTVCNPVPNTEMAPWNWGDAAEGGGEKPDTSLVVTESIRGKWKSVDDPKFVREFKENDVVDYHDGKEVSTGLWVAFTKENAPKLINFPIAADAVYLQLTMNGTPHRNA